MSDEEILKPRDGAIRCPDSTRPGEYVVADPHDRLYSTVVMQATEYFDAGEWKPLFDTTEEPKP